MPTDHRLHWSVTRTSSVRPGEAGITPGSARHGFRTRSSATSAPIAARWPITTEGDCGGSRLWRRCGDERGFRGAGFPIEEFLSICRHRLQPPNAGTSVRVKEHNGNSAQLSEDERKVGDYSHGWVFLRLPSPTQRCMGRLASPSPRCAYNLKVRGPEALLNGNQPSAELSRGGLCGQRGLRSGLRHSRQRSFSATSWACSPRGVSPSPSNRTGRPV